MAYRWVRCTGVYWGEGGVLKGSTNGFTKEGEVEHGGGSAVGGLLCPGADGTCHLVLLCPPPQRHPYREVSVYVHES